MMSILFKGVEMPKGCWDCPFQTNPICATNDILNFTTRTARPDNCPLIEVPEDVKPVKQGRWEKAQTRGIVSYADCYAECSACHGKPVFLGWDMKFCPNCGARMDGEA